MDRPAVIEGCYVDLKFMPGIKCARVSIDIPIEHSNTFLKMFDAPDRANPVPVVIARLATSTAEQPSGAQAPSTPKPDRAYTRSQIAAMKCRDDEFCIWIAKTFPAVFDKHYYQEPGGPDGSKIAADLTLKEVLGIQSKKELDVEGPKAQAFDKLLASFDYRNQVR